MLKGDDIDVFIISIIFSFVLVDFFRKVVFLNINNKYVLNYFIFLMIVFDFILDGVFVIFL